MRVLILVELGEEGLQVVGVGDALALEKLLACGLRALNEEAHRVRLQLKMCGRKVDNNKYDNVIELPTNVLFLV